MKSGICSIGISSVSQLTSDIDSLVLACNSGMNCFSNCNIDKSTVGACFTGSETRPYSVKTMASMVASFLGLPHNIFAGDIEFACKAGTTAMINVSALIESGKIECGLAVASDVAVARSDDPLERTVGSGSVSVLLSNSDYFCEIIDYASVSFDIADFWKAKNEDFPSHEGRFTGDGGYFKCVKSAYELIKLKCGFENEDISHLALHMPNAKFPIKIARELGFNDDVLKFSNVFEKYSNCFTATVLLGLESVLRSALPEQNILMISYGSGGGSDAVLLRTNRKIIEFQKRICK